MCVHVSHVFKSWVFSTLTLDKMDLKKIEKNRNIVTSIFLKLDYIYLIRLIKQIKYIIPLQKQIKLITK
jgi:hypothetical protein